MLPKTFYRPDMVCAVSSPIEDTDGGLKVFVGTITKSNWLDVLGTCSSTTTYEACCVPDIPLGHCVTCGTCAGTG